MIKIYLKSVLISSIPVLLGGWCFFNIDNALVILIAPIIGFIISWIYIYEYVHSKKDRIKLFLLNPIFYFWIFVSVVLLWWCIDAAKNGFHPWNY